MKDLYIVLDVSEKDGGEGWTTNGYSHTKSFGDLDAATNFAKRKAGSSRDGTVYAVAKASAIVSAPMPEAVVTQL